MSTHQPPGLEQARFQFGMKHLLLTVPALCVLFGMAVSLGVPGIVLFFVVGGFALGIHLHQVKYIVFAALLACLAPLVQLAQPTWVQYDVPHLSCQSNLRTIALAMHQYHDKYGCLPPAYLADTNGKPMHSWRVLLLPYLEQQALYTQYDFAEPWNGPNNRRLSKQAPAIFTCPEDAHRATDHTTYVVVTGEETVFKGAQSMSLDNLTAMDGTSITLLAVECAESGINWMEPRDLEFAQMNLKINDFSATPGIRSRHTTWEGANVVFADASARYITEDVEPKALRGVFTANGGESPLRF